MFIKKRFKKLDFFLQFIFFDGEEAFKDWTDTDSLYGSRALANSLAKLYGSKAFDTINLFVLLDLIGAETCQFPNYFSATSDSYATLSQIGMISFLFIHRNTFNFLILF